MRWIFWSRMSPSAWQISCAGRNARGGHFRPGPSAHPRGRHGPLCPELFVRCPLRRRENAGRPARTAGRRAGRKRPGGHVRKSCRAADPEAAAAIHPNNQVRVLRALEHYRATGKRLSEQKAQSLPPERPYRSLVLGLDFPDRAQLYRRIDLRVDKMLDAGLLDEAKLVYDHRAALPHGSAGHRLQGVLLRILSGRPRWMPALKSSSRPPATTPSAS